MTTPSKTEPRRKAAAKKMIPLRSLDTAEVILNVTEFRDVFKQDPAVKRPIRLGMPPPRYSRGTRHKMWMPRPHHPQVYIKRNEPNTIHIKSKAQSRV